MAIGQFLEEMCFIRALNLSSERAHTIQDGHTCWTRENAHVFERGNVFVNSYKFVFTLKKFKEICGVRRIYKELDLRMFTFQ